MAREAYIQTEYRIVWYTRDGQRLQCIEVNTYRDDDTGKRMVTLSYGPGEGALEWHVPLKEVEDTGQRVFI